MVRIHTGPQNAFKQNRTMKRVQPPAQENCSLLAKPNNTQEAGRPVWLVCKGTLRLCVMLRMLPKLRR